MNDLNRQGNSVVLMGHCLYEKEKYNQTNHYMFRSHLSNLSNTSSCIMTVPHHLCLYLSISIHLSIFLSNNPSIGSYVKVSIASTTMVVIPYCSAGQPSVMSDNDA